MDQPPPSEAPAAAAVVRRPERKRPLGAIIGVGLLGASAAFYFGLGSGLRRGTVDEESDGFKARGGNSLGTQGSASMRDEIDFQRGRQLAEERKAKAAAELSRQFGRSSVVYLKAGTAADASGRLNYEDVAEGAGRTIHGILRPRDARRKPNAITLSDSEITSALKAPVPGGEVAGKMPDAGHAVDLAPVKVAALLPPRVDIGGAPTSGAPSALLTATESSDSGGTAGRQMTVLKLGGVDGEYTASKAVNPEPGRVAETMATTEVPPVGMAQSLGAASLEGGPKGSLQKFSGKDAVEQAVQAVETGDAKKSQIAKLTSAYAYGKLGAEKGVSHDPRVELGGIVFDGKKPPEAKLAGLDESRVGDPGGGNLRMGAADKLEGELQKCRDAERAAAQAMQALSDAGKELRRTKVNQARDLQYSCFQKWKVWDDCEKSDDKKKNCGPKKTAWKRSQRPVKDKIREVEAEAGKLAQLCKKFDEKSAEKQAQCSAIRSEALGYGSCQEIVDRPKDDANRCRIPVGEKGGGGECECFK